MSKVFVSYKRVDKEKVLPIVHQLDKKLGIKCWVDLDGIESDEQFTNVIIKAIKECEVFLFMFSKSHEDIDPKRDWTVREITFADKKDKRIVFIDLDGNELPDWFLFKFPDQQVVKASDSHAMDKLAKDMCKWLGLPQTNSSPNNQGHSTDTIVTQTRPHHQSETQEPSDSHQAIDLGLPSGTKWASCNVGASKPEEYGDYFAWGETETKDVYDSSTYKNGKTFLQEHFFKPDEFKYEYADLGCNIAGTKYDVAYVKWGGNWRLPTIEQFEELFNNCHHEWTTLNRVKGYKFTSKINGNSIFLPAVGYYYNSGLCNSGSYGCYWSSTQYPSNLSSAYNLYFCSGDSHTNYSNRYLGQGVRPVIRD